VAELEKHLDPEIEVVEVDAHINTPEFAKAVVDMAMKTLKLKIK